MHELSLVQQEVAKASKKIKEKKVHKIFFSLGKLAHGTPESIKEAFSLAVSDTPLFGAEVVVNVIEPKVKCSSCGYEFASDREITLACPKCRSTSTEVVSGKECCIDHLEFDK